MNALIDLENVGKVYAAGAMDVHAVTDLSLTVHSTEFLAILGASGSGKSTLMNILGCLDSPTYGRYLLDGRDVSGLTREERAAIRNAEIGFVFQGFNLLSRTTALDNVALPLFYSPDSPAGLGVREKALRALDQVGLSDRASHSPNQLSGGQQQRVAIARALVNAPILLIADEPTGNLDSRTSVEIMGIFQELNAAGITIIMVTHELDVARFARRNVFMRDGRIVRDSPVMNRLVAAEELARLRMVRGEMETDL
jgi:putative ABC transport system ATP-binding protein